MSQHNFSYTEVIPDQTVVEKWKEITLNTGGRQSTLQDIKVAERSGGYCYEDSTSSCTRNRFIYWRISHDILELTEQSLDVDLHDNSVRYKFVDTPILDGITIHETHTSVVVLVPTVCSVHRLAFTHPARARRDDRFGLRGDVEGTSVFAEASAAHTTNPASFHIINSSGGSGSQLPLSATSWYSAAKDESYFLFAYPSGEVLLIKYYESGVCEIIELKSESIVPRFLHGVVEKLMSKSSDGNVVVSMVLHTIGLETYALTLSKSGHLRVWSCSKGQCISVTDVLLATSYGESLSHGSQNHMMKKAVGGNELHFLLAVVLNFTPECQFHIFLPEVSGNQFKLIKIATLSSPGVDLVDFSLTTSRLWSVWRGEDGDSSVYTTTLATSGEKGSHWVPVPLEPPPDSNEFINDSHLDPKEVYLKSIFRPGRFSLNVIGKALSIYTKSSALSDISLSANVLKQQVSVAVETEIQQELAEVEVSDDEYTDCAQWCWSQFYSCCVQYHMTGLRPLGILLLPSVSGAVLLKKSTYSFLRPLDTLEHLYLCNEYVTKQQILSHPQLGISPEETDALIELMEVLVYLDRQLNDPFKETFVNEIAQLKAPDQVVNEMITEIIPELAHGIISKLKQCQNIYNGMHKLLELLRVQQLVNEDEEDKIYPKLPFLVDRLFASQMGISFVTQCLRQQAYVRFAICRNLLILQNIVINNQDENFGCFDGIRSICVPETVLLIQAYYNVLWLTSLPIQTNVALEQSLQKLVSLKLPPVFNLNLNSNVLLMDLFIGSKGGFKLSKNDEIDEETIPYWNYSLLAYLDQIFLILWPLNGDPSFCEWLLSSGQHVWLQQYDRSLNTWWEENCSRKFLLAASYLTSGEHHKAYDLFLESSSGAHKEKYLLKQISNIASENQNLTVQYFLKVIQLFEAYNARNYAIELATFALPMTERNDFLRATLYSIRFMHHLALGHYEDAYKSLQSNPDADRKNDNLRDLVKTLLDKRDLNVLMSFTYGKLEQLFCNILFMRARATDTIENVFYDFLYSYQIKRGLPYYRLAGAVMYEQAFRLNQHTTIEALEKQVKCYMAAANALTLCDPKHAWVLKPVEPELQDEVVTLPTRAGLGLPYERVRLRKQVEVVDAAAVRKQLTLAVARLRLAKVDRDSAAARPTPAELVALLASRGVFKCALELCAAYGVSPRAPFQGLTRQCVLLTRNNNPADGNAWNWLTENDLHDLTSIGNTPADVAWQLLETFLYRYEKERMSDIHQYICEKIMNMESFIPHWLVASYKMRNPNELLRLYYYKGYLIEASELAIEYLLALLTNQGCQYFGYAQGLVPGAKPLCVPVNVIERLLRELDLQNKADPTKPLARQQKVLKEVYVKYLEISNRISTEACRLALSEVVV